MVTSDARTDDERAQLVRRRAAWVLCLVGLPALTLVLTTVRAHVAVGSALMLDLCIVIAVAALGGVRAGVVASVLASGLTNWFLTPPLHQLTVSDAENVVALTVFLFVTVVVSVLVARVTRQSHEAAAARSHAAALARSAATLIAASDPLPELLDQVRATFELQSAALFERSDGRWNEICSSGPTHPDDFGGRSIEVESGNVKLVTWGGELGAVELDVLKAFAAQLAAALETIELRREAERAAVAGQADALRTTILQAVSHDFRTPLATIMAAATGLLRSDADFSDDDHRVLLSEIESAAYRLDKMVRDLLDISRLQAGAITLRLEPTALEDVVAAALAGVPTSDQNVTVDIDECLPLVLADAALLERAIANLVSNAIAWSPPGDVVLVTATSSGDWVDVSVIDHGPGIAEADRERVYVPFERSGDRSNDAGAGLGLAIARGFVEIIGGVLRFDDTPNGGLTMTICIRPAGVPG